jgi:hypothetical protein
MQSRHKIRLGAACAAVAVTVALAASFGPAANGLEHLLRRAFDALSPQGQTLAKTIVRFLPYWLPGTVIALTAGVIGWRQQRRGEDDEPGRTTTRRLS